MELQGKTAIVTGGTKGIGRGIAEALLRVGVNVCLSARHEAEIERTVVELNSIGEGRAVGFVCDVRNHDEVRSLLENANNTFGGIDILVNNAGIGIFNSVENMSVEDFRATLETNLFGVFYCCHEAIPLMKKLHHQHFLTRRH